MKPFLTSLLLLLSFRSIFGQTDQDKFYLGVSYGKSFSLGDFGDNGVHNPEAGFADNGNKLDIFGGYFLTDRVTLTSTLRYQTFETETGTLIESYNGENPNANFSGTSEDWKVYYLLVGAAYKFDIYKKFCLFPRFGIGPLVVNNPGISVASPNSAITKNFSRNSGSGIGFGYEIGIGLKTDLGERFALMPTFTFSGGFTTIPDVNTTTDNVIVSRNYDVKIQSFNLGLAIAYKFF